MPRGEAACSRSRRSHQRKAPHVAFPRGGGRPGYDGGSKSNPFRHGTRGCGSVRAGSRGQIMPDVACMSPLGALAIARVMSSSFPRRWWVGGRGQGWGDGVGAMARTSPASMVAKRGTLQEDELGHCLRAKAGG